MKKLLIKVIKRQDAKIISDAKTRSASEAKQNTPDNKEKTESRSRLEIAVTVSNWISERRKNNHLEKISAIRKLFGDEPSLSEV